MHIYKSGLLALLGWLALLQPLAAEERILSFDSHITVARDGTLEVREVIKVLAEGDSIRRGIVREFPTSYHAANGHIIVVGFSFESATRDGNPEPWRIEPHDNGVLIYLGSKAVELPQGEHVYELVYRTDRQMGFFADHDELYWNVTGNGSKIHIVSAPVYYHNYMMGQLFASQVHHALCRDVYNGADPSTVIYVGDHRVGEFMKTKVFEPGRRYDWRGLTTFATGEERKPTAFAADFKEK